MDVRRAIQAKLLTHAEITAEVGERVYQAQAPENAERPYVLIDSEGAGDFVQHSGGVVGIHQEVQVAVWADTFDAVDDISELIRLRLDRLENTTLSTVDIVEIGLQESWADSVQQPSDGSRYLFVRETNYIISYAVAEAPI